VPHVLEVCRCPSPHYYPDQYRLLNGLWWYFSPFPYRALMIPDAMNSILPSEPLPVEDNQ